jgi:alpha-N-acetylglucosaminidase
MTVLSVALTAQAAEFYIAPSGNDANPGTEGRPFASLERARDAIRDATNRNHLVVVLREGIYPQEKPLEFDARDCGTRNQPVVWKSAPGETACIIGGIVVPAISMERVDNSAILNRLISPEARNGLLEIDLAALGVTNCGQIGLRGFGRPKIPAPLELIVSGQVMPISCWPKLSESPAPIGKVLDKGSLPSVGEKPDRGAKFVVNTNRPLFWQNANDVWITGLFANGYADATLQLASIIQSGKDVVFTTVQPHIYGFQSGKPWNNWRALNVLEEIGRPGEWAIDYKAKKLYFLPPTGYVAGQTQVMLSTLASPVLALRDVSHVRFESLNVECSRGDGVSIRGGDEVVFSGCTFRNLGSAAVTFDATGKNHRLENCVICDTGAGGVGLNGGDRKTLTPGNNTVSNCIIHSFNRWSRTYCPAVALAGVGNCITHCLIYDAPGCAILLHGNNHLIEYNEIHHVMEQGDDMGAFYMGRNPTEFGNIIRNNYFHDIGFGQTDKTYGIYLDDCSCGTEIYGNLLVRAGRQAAFLIGGGKYHKIHDNIIVDSALAFQIDNRGQTWAPKTAWFPKSFHDEWDQMKASQPPFSTAYPELANYWQDKPEIPANSIESNLIFNCRKFTNGKPEWGGFTNNWETMADPGFVNAAKDDYRLKPDAEAFQKIPGFKPVPLNQIGIQEKEPDSSEGATASDSALSAAQGLIGRLLPGYEDKMVCQIIPTDDGRDVFEIETRNGRVILRGNNGVSIASALNWYLKYYCHCQVSWCGDQLKLPNPLPGMDEKIRKVSPYQYRYAFNYCTFGYAMAFWDWDQWQREIDFMALNGVNTPLAITGAEVAYRNVFRSFGIGDKAINGFIAGPPYLPWFLMGNLDGFGGPNSPDWYDQQEVLQKKILAREREFGMKPVLPAFEGHVPEALKEKFPQAKMVQVKSWSGFSGTWLLDPNDPLFREIGARMLRETKCLYGTDHLYSADTFNELTPPSSDPAYLTSVSRQVYQGMADEDPEAIWFMQDWLFLFDKFWTPPRVEALLAGAPNDRMVVIDLFSDGQPMWQATHAFVGKPWLWCIIHNWGGKQGMYGRMDRIGTELPGLLNNSDAGRLSGIGTLNEGNDVNPIVFDQFYEMAWRNKPVDLKEWVRQYAWRRYGKDNPNARKAWEILATTLYECKDPRHGPQGSFFAMPPSLSEQGGGFVRGSIFYDSSRVQEAFRLLLKASGELGNQDTYRFDLVDLGRQVMSDISQQQLHSELRASFEAGDAARFDRAVTAWMEAFEDTDRLLRTHRLFQFGHYLEFPLNVTSNTDESARYEANARRLITLWGGPDNELFGYSQRQYGGLMGDYNRGAWQIFLGYASRALHEGGKFDSIAADQMVRQYTEAWIHRRDRYPSTAQGDTIAEARMILNKYVNIVRPMARPQGPIKINDHE